MKRLRYIQFVIYIIFLSKLHYTAAKAIKTKLLQIQEQNKQNMSLVEADESTGRRRKKVAIVDAILFLIQKFEKSFSGYTRSNDKIKDSQDVAETDYLDDSDADKAFLMSVLPDLKNLDDDEKLEFRLHTLQFFKNIRNGNERQVFQQQQQPYYGMQSPNHPMLSQYFLNYHSQQSMFPSGYRDNNFPPSAYVGAPHPLSAPTTLDTTYLPGRQEPIFCDSLSKSKHLDDYLLDLK